jgi:hypothetical protein
MKYLPNINSSMIHNCENTLEKSLLYFIREVQCLSDENIMLREQDELRIKQIRRLEEKLLLLKNNC